MYKEASELIDMLYTMVSEAWGVPLNNDKCMVNREEFLGILEEIKVQLPTELAEAKRLVSARDEFIGSAKKEAESIRRAAEGKARQLVDEREIVRIAQSRSHEIISNTEYKSSELKKLASDYVDDILRRTEESLTSSLNQISKSRSRFRSMTGAQEMIQENSTSSMSSEIEL